jgi:hypothetical protein
VNHFPRIKALILPLAVLLLVSSCSLDSDGPELPPPIRSYFLLYNYYDASPFDLVWIIDGYMLSAVHSYGETIMGYMNLDQATQDVAFVARNPNSGATIKIDTFRVEENKYYMLAIIGKEEPYILFDSINIAAPVKGKIKFRFIHAASELDSLDLYAGGISADHRLISGIAYGQLSGYVESSPVDLGDTLFVTPHNAGSDTILTTFTKITYFLNDRSYLGIIAHPLPADTATLDLIFNDQPSLY